jgi:diguanylate cyclase (GGDEF)-like protein
VLLLLLINLAFTTAARQPSFLLLMSMMALLLFGDLSYAIVGVWGDRAGNRWMDLPFLVGFTAVGAAALHRSVVEISRAVPLPAQAWSWPRMLLIGPAVCVPFVLIPLRGQQSLGTDLLLAVGGAAIVALLIFRAVSAVQAYAEAQRRAEYQATHDELTGLPNRSRLAMEVDSQLANPPARGDRMWLFYLDLDGFKLVNDSWGHAAGDQLIAEVAERLRRLMPDEATVARVGGDEFVVAYVGHRDEAVPVADQLLDCFSEPLRMRTAEVVISASVGIAGVSFDEAGGATAEAMMRDADTAMYQAKSEGPGKWTMFDASMHERVRERVEIEYALRHALGQDEL